MSNFIQIIQLELTNGKKYNHLNTDRVIIRSKLQSYRSRAQQVLRERSGIDLKVSVIYADYPANAEIVGFYHNRPMANWYETHLQPMWRRRYTCNIEWLVYLHL